MIGVLLCQAQKHLTFLDIPIEGSLESFSKRLEKELGYRPMLMNKGDSYADCESKKFMGKFMDFHNMTIFAHRFDKLKEVSSVTVNCDSLAYSEYNLQQLNNLIKEFNNKYGNYKSDSIALVGRRYRWDLNNGLIEIFKTSLFFHITYKDYTEVKANDIKPINDGEIDHSIEDIINESIKKERSLQANREQVVKEICGIPFGSSYEESMRRLENKYGEPEYYPNKTVISYKNKNYGGLDFDAIHFLFQSDGVKSYLNGCVFIIEAKSLTDARKKRDMLYNKLLEKYIIVPSTDNNGETIYLGGTSPVPNAESFGFSIEILKYDSKVAKSSIPYAARLMYGRYNYVKEEF